MLKKCAPFISEHLSQFLNSFMRLGIFPQKLKVGKVSPIFKKGDVQLFDNYRLRGSCHKLLTNYLSKREQYINFKGTDSDVQEVEFGVPQGSVLGPLLFLIYINDLVNSSTRGDFVLFADDTNIFVPGKTKIEAYENAQIVLNGIHEYMFSNQLHINLTKSVYMHLRPYLNQNDQQTCARCRIEKNLKLGNFTMKKVKEVKFLGVIIDDELSWGPQINYLREKLISSIVIIKRIKNSSL